MDKFIGKREYFTPEKVKKIVDEKKLTSVANLERALFSLEYVGQLWESGADIVFKGGSAVQILLGDAWNRLSVDVDICTELSVNDIESHMDKIQGRFESKCFTYEYRENTEGDMFQCYRVTTLPITDIQRKFLFDIQTIKPRYNITKTTLKSFFYDSGIQIHTPTVSSILGDKMSIIGPQTIGRKLDDSRNGLEYAKHFYDIYSLSNKFNDYSETRKTYKSCVEIQSDLRGRDYTNRECIEDAILTCKIASLPYDQSLTKSMVSDQKILQHYKNLKNGVQRFSPFIVGERLYTWESMREYASKTATLFKEFMDKPKQSKQDEIDQEEMIDTLMSLPVNETWFMDFDDLRLSPKVLTHWYQYYQK